MLNFNGHLHFFSYHYIVVIVPNNFADLLQAFNCEDINYKEVNCVCAPSFIVCALFGLIDPTAHLLFAFDLECLFDFLMTFELECHFSLHLSIFFVLLHSSSMLGCILFLTNTLLYFVCIVVLLQ